MTRPRAPLRIAAVQCVARQGDIAGTATEHAAQIDAAADSGASVVLFPELSLTGYEPEMIDLHGLRVAVDDSVLRPILLMCRQRKVHALIGAPTGSGVLPQIGVLHVDSSGAVRVAYAKQHLQIGEIGIFSAGSASAVLEIGGWRLALSVGADAGVGSHPVAARSAGADAYLVGALYLIGAEHRIDEQMRRAAAAGLWTVLAQYSGGTGGGPACGLSGGWRPDGTEVVRLGAGPGMAIVDLTVPPAL
jgi:predicted amidohydrolase